jgi:hypothetical protein
MRAAIALLLFSLTAWSLSVGHASAQAGPPGAQYTTATSLNTIIGGLRTSLDALLGPISQTASRRAFELRQHLEILSQTLAYLLVELEGKTYGQLDADQRVALAGVGAAVAGWRDPSTLTLADVSPVVARVDALFASIGSAEGAPRVLTVSPPYVALSDTVDESVTVKVTGAHLAGGKPTLRFDTRFCDLREDRASEIVFVCRPGTFVAGETVAIRTGTLALPRERSLLQRLFRSRQATHEYRVAVPVVPPTMGTYVAAAAMTMNRLENAWRETQEFAHTNDFCEGPHEAAWTVKATPGWAVDVKTIEVRELARTGHSETYGARNRTASGFQLGGVARNDGRCGEDAGGARTQDVKGSLRVKAVYREYRMAAFDTSVELGQGPVRWGQEIAVLLPEQLKGFTIEVKQVDGRSVMVSEAPATHAWFTVSAGAAPGQLVIRPRTVTEAHEHESRMR